MDTLSRVRQDNKTDIEIAKKCFEYVRDNINHTGDCKDNISTCKASDVLSRISIYALMKLSFAVTRTKR